MARVARIVVPECPHHVTQRGNRRCDVFRDDADREIYLHCFRGYAQKHRLRVWAYCLMTNHVHWVVVPEAEFSLGRSFRDAHTVYALGFNHRTGLEGHLWQGRFFSCPLDESHAWAAVRYVERNPVRAGLVTRAQDYPWSSAAAHCGLRKDPLLDMEMPLLREVEDWAAWLDGEDDHESTERLRQQTQTGRPCGSETFIERLESLLNRTLRPRKRGRKPKKAAERKPVDRNS